MTTINELRKKHGKNAIGYSGSLELLSCRLNKECGFSHSCAEKAEILYSEYGYDQACHV